MDRINITQEQLFEAVMNIFVDGGLKELTNNVPIALLLAPIIGIELWNELTKEKEEVEDGR